MPTQKTIIACLVPRKAFVLATISCGIILGLFLWKFFGSKNFHNGELSVLTAIFSIGFYLTLKLSTYQLILYNDRIIRKLWWKKNEIFYKDIDKLIINAACFDAYKIGKAMGPQISEKLRKYQIFDVWLIGNVSTIHFKTKWFDSMKQVNDALSFLMEKCPPNKLKRDRNSNSSTVHDIKLVIKWIIIFCISTYAANLLFQY